MASYNGYTNKETSLISIYFKDDIQSLDTFVFDLELFKENYYIIFSVTPTESEYDNYLVNKTNLLAKEIEELVFNTLDDFLSETPIPAWILDFISFENVDYFNLAQSFLDYYKLKKGHHNESTNQ